MFCRFLILVICFCNILAVAGQDISDKQLVDFFDDLYYGNPEECQARYALNQIASRHSWKAFSILRGDWPSTPETRQEARAHLLKLKADIEQGFNWPIKTPPTFNIPFAQQAPKLDGKLDEAIWQKALALHGEYPLDSVKESDKTSLWLITYDKKNIYIGACFKDHNPIGVEYNQDKKIGPWQGDSLEIFLMPSKRLRNYREIVVGCNGALFSSLHLNNKWGTFINGRESENIKTIKAKVTADKSGYTVEVAVPFKELPNYMLGNVPKPGEKMYFAIVRTNTAKKGESPGYFSAFPLMYGSHNVFGYAEGILRN